MDEQIKDVKKKLLEVNETISQLDPAIRSSAFDILAPYYFTDHTPAHTSKPPATTTKKKDTGSKSPANVDDADIGTFINSFDHTLPKDNVTLIVAWLYQKYGKYPITTKDIKDLSGETGLVVPTRPDNTMRQATRKGKALFQQQGKGWQLTVSGELFLKETYKVKKGNNSKPQD